MSELIPIADLVRALPADEQLAHRRALEERGISAGGTIVQLAADQLVTQNPLMQRVKAQAQQLARMNCKVTVYGETGTGKELIAKILHGDRDYQKGNTDSYGLSQGEKFFPVNCAGITTPLFESSLFGYVKNSHSMAFKDSPGILRSAAGGTVFLDEIGDLPADQQAKILRVLESSRVLPVGGVVEIPIDVRFVFATNKPLAKMVERGEFREDLFYRITEVELTTIPLRNRPEDVWPIASAICLKEHWTLPEEIPPAAYENGNVRALRNYLLRENIAGRGRVESIRQVIDYARASHVLDVSTGDSLAAAELHKISKSLGLDVAADGWPGTIMEKIKDLISNQAE